MNLILLGGNSIDNKKWINDVEQNLKSLFETTKIIDYEHWETGGLMINLDKEKEKLIKTVQGFKRYMIFAKSAGILVTIKAIYENKILPEKCIFAGLPLKWAKKNNFNIDVWLRNYSVPTVVIQHIDDPLASSQEVQSFLRQENTINIGLKELPGNTHDYNEHDLIYSLTEDLLK